MAILVQNSSISSTRYWIQLWIFMVLIKIIFALPLHAQVTHIQEICTITLPQTLEQRSYMNEDADFAGIDMEHMIYLLVFCEAKKERGYLAPGMLSVRLEGIQRQVAEDMVNIQLGYVTRKQVRPGKGVQSWLTGDSKGEHLTFKIVCLETKQHLAHIIVWTPSELLDKNATEISRIIESMSMRR